MYRMRRFERRRAAENFYKDAIRQVKENGYYMAGDKKVYDTVEHLEGMLQNLLRTCC